MTGDYVPLFALYFQFIAILYDDMKRVLIQYFFIQNTVMIQCNFPGHIVV